MYVDAFHSRQKDTIYIVERIDGQRVYKDLKANHVLYYTHDSGSYRSIYNDTLKKYRTNKQREFKAKIAELEAQGKKLFESDFNPVFRCLSENYRNCETPKLQIGLFDIEVGFDPNKGFAPTNDPFNEVTAISLYRVWEEALVTLVLCPPSLTTEQAEEITSKFDNTILYDDEKQLLSDFLTFIDDCDVVSGWNSEGYDIPYLVNRITRLLGKAETRRFCLWNQLPRAKEIEKFGKTLETYDLVGRVHLDYLLLYQKHNPQQLHSYRLDFVGEVEVGENKVPYSGTLDQLYKQDFEKFVAYNRQDVMLLAKIDAKKRFVELANQVAHANTVLLKTTMGTVALVEQAIINEIHDKGLIVPNRKPRGEETGDDEEIDDTFLGFADEEVNDDEDGEKGEGGHNPVVGAYVAKPKIGLHDELACCDIASLYPSAIRALNMSPETIVGQLRPTETMALVAERVKKLPPAKRAEAWDGIFALLEYDHVLAKDEHPVTVDFEDGTTVTLTGRELYEYLFDPNNHLCITANGTIFTTKVTGIIPSILSNWYANRKAQQAKEKDFQRLRDGVEDAAQKAEYEEQRVFWNQRQQATKIMLNATYGSLLNERMRFYDARLGQSTTLTGRSIDRHMCAKVNETITGVYDYVGDAIIYADTDSVYFTAKNILDIDHLPREEIIELYDSIADKVNDSFPAFMNERFNTGLERGGIIKAGRELVGSKGLFIKKKKYAVLMYDKEGERLDKDGKPGKLKIMGLDLKRSDTPAYMQKFLEKILLDLLTGSTKTSIFADIRQFRTGFVARPGWEKGSPKKVNGLTVYSDRRSKMDRMSIRALNERSIADKAKVNIPWHVLAALNYNVLRAENNDHYSMEIQDGAKVIVCKLRPNNVLGMKAIAYPVDEPHLPDWFKKLPFDHDEMENAIIDKKLDNLLGVLEWDLSETKVSEADNLFTFAS